MATHHEHRRVEYIADDLDRMAARLEMETRTLRDMAKALRDQVANDGQPLDGAERQNIRAHVRRVLFSVMRSTVAVTSTETMMVSLDRFAEERD